MELYAVSTFIVVGGPSDCTSFYSMPSRTQNYPSVSLRGTSNCWPLVGQGLTRSELLSWISDDLNMVIITTPVSWSRIF